MPRWAGNGLHFMRRKKLPGFGKDFHGSWELKPAALNEWNWKPIGDNLWEAKKIEEGGYIGKEEGRKKRQNKERPGVCKSSKNVAECLVCAGLGTVLRPMRKCMSKTETLWADGMEARL